MGKNLETYGVGTSFDEMIDYAKNMKNIDEEKANDILDKLLKKQEQDQKKLKAFEIIKDAPTNYKEGLLYTFQHMLISRVITSEQFDLLKEVLL